MNTNFHNSEKGQAIVYLAVGLVVFLGFVALAVDGGMALADRRNSQNGADAASLAGGGAAAYRFEQNPVCYADYSCDHTAEHLAEDAAIERAGFNDLTISKTDFSDHNDVNAECGSIQYPGYLDKFIDVTVEISSTTRSNFAQVLFPDALHNEVEAVTRVRPSQPFGFGNAIVALNPEGCSGQQNGVNVSGGSAYRG